MSLFSVRRAFSFEFSEEFVVASCNWILLFVSRSPVDTKDVFRAMIPVIGGVALL
jgi:hypothetical protein